MEKYLSQSSPRSSANLRAAPRIRSVFMSSRLFQIVLVLLMAGLGSSCTGWPRGWAQAKNAPTTDGLSGAWEGTWRSHANGHTGRLRCAVFPKSPNTWEYRYRASWAKVLCAGFTVECTGHRQRDGTWRVTGERDLGPVFGGVFRHVGTVAGDRLEARYEAAVDEGELSLQRVK